MHIHKIKLFFLLLISFFLLSAKPTGGLTALLKRSITIKNGDNFDLEKVSKKSHLLFMEGASFNSAVLRSFNTDKIDDEDLFSYANMVGYERYLGYYSVVPGFGNFYIPTTSRCPSLLLKSKSQYYAEEYADLFKKYYHKLFKNKTTRTILFNTGLESVKTYCKYFPKDFTTAVIKELDRLLIFTTKLGTLTYDKYSRDVNNQKIDFWEGFIYRRVKTDGVPVSEVRESIIKAQSELKSMDVSNNPDVMNEININDQVMLYYGTNQYSLKSVSNQKIIHLEPGLVITDIKYLKDRDGEFYQIKGCRYYGVADWLLNYYEKDEFSYLYDKYLNKIY